MTGQIRVEGFTAVPNWLVRETDLSAYELLVLLALTGRMNATGECWPSYETLAKEARCSVSTVRRSLDSLSARGLVIIRHQFSDRDGGQTSNRYAVNLNPVGVRPQAGGGVHTEQGGVSQGTGGVFPRNNEEDTLEEDPVEEEPPTPLRADLFDQFWKNYPKSRNITSARAAWARLPRTVDKRRVVAQAEAYTLACSTGREDIMYVPNPAKWLAEQGWENDYRPKRPPAHLNIAQ